MTPTRSRHRTPRSARGTTFALTAAIGALSIGSGCTTNHYYDQFFIDDRDGGSDGEEPEPTTSSDAGSLPPSDGGGDAGAEPVSPGAPLPDTAPDALDLNVLNEVGNHYWLVVSDEQLQKMNRPYDGGGPVFVFNMYGDIYTPGGEGDEPTFVDHFFATNAKTPAATADFGQVQVRLIGQSTGRAWTTETLPNFKIDSDEFQAGLRIGGVKHVRFNNAVVGGIYREKLALDLYRRMNYPAPRATYAWVSSNVWGAETKIPYVVVESYKPQFCKARETQFGGECVNMWELAGDFGYGAFEQPESCQFTECENSRVSEFDQAVLETPPGEGFKAALSEWLDWDSFHRFQCLSWVLETGDDAIHNTNNLVLAERADGKFQMLPYSIDISLGQDWYPDVSLAGSSSLARGCQADPQCWADTISACERIVQKFTDLDPVAMLDEQHATLEQTGMLRPGDDGRYESLRKYLEQRIEELPAELEANREAPPTDVLCDAPFVDCGGYCALPEDCVLCDPGPVPVDPRPLPLKVAGLAAEPFEPALPAEPVGDAGVDQDPVADVILNPIPVPGEEPVDDPIGEPIPCLPAVVEYGK